MSRATLNAKCRLCRAEGSKLYLKGARCLSAKCPIEKKGAVKPGMHGVKNVGKLSDYGKQLRAKQKAKRIFGVQETQFHNTYDKAKKMKGLLGDNLMTLLHRRLDNVIYSAGIALSRSSAKQLITHKNILINNRILNVPSYTVKVGDIISLSSKAIERFGENMPNNDKDFKAPTWLDINKKDYSVKVISLPLSEETNKDIDANLIIEYYSR